MRKNVPETEQKMISYDKFLRLLQEMCLLDIIGARELGYLFTFHAMQNKIGKDQFLNIMTEILDSFNPLFPNLIGQFKAVC